MLLDPEVPLGISKSDAARFCRFQLRTVRQSDDRRDPAQLDPFADSDSCHRFRPTLIAIVPDAMRKTQKTFDRTGGLHAAALFDEEGRLLVVREDVGRHNAVDKVLGHAL